MSIQNAGTIIRLARKAAGLTQEQLSEGICSVVLLSQIENGAKGVSSATFEALMSRAGKLIKAIPYFSSRTDFDCFYCLKKAHFYIDSWQLENAYNELNIVESVNWADNKLHYAEWLLLHAKIQFFSGQCDHPSNYQLLLHCLSLTNPTLSTFDLSSCLLSKTEIETLILIAHEALYTNQMELSYDICNQIRKYIEHSDFSHMDKSRLLADTNIIVIKYHLAQHEYETALSLASSSREIATRLHLDMPLLQLTFLYALCLYYLENIKDSIHFMKVVLYSAHAIKSCYATICIQFLQKHLSKLPLEEIFPLENIPLHQFTEKTPITNKKFSSGTYNIHSHKAVSIGKLIQTLRMEQGISLVTLCQGLCSKAKLSKIENEQQQADILLLEALLQRLGISDRPFTFWGNDDENKFHELKFKSLQTQQLHLKDLKTYISQMKALTNKKDILQTQFILFQESQICTTADEELSMLFDALHCTIPDFHINKIHEYHLSWTELSCLNNIARIYAKMDNSLESFHYFRQLFDYYESSAHDVLFRSSTYMLTHNMFCRSLYSHKHFQDIVNTFANTHIYWSNFPLDILASFLFYYCQAYGECKELKSAHHYGNYACALEYLTGLDPNAIALKQYLYNDFHITLNI